MRPSWMRRLVFTRLWMGPVKELTYIKNTTSSERGMEPFRIAMLPAMATAMGMRLAKASMPPQHRASPR